MAKSKDILRRMYRRQHILEQQVRQLEQAQRRYRKKRRDGGFPFNLVEKAIRWLLNRLEKTVGVLVSAGLSKIRKL